MEGVEGTEPPSKRRKGNPSSSGVGDSMGEVQDDELIGFRGVKKSEFVRLIEESLHTLGYKQTSEYLEIESGIALSSSVVNEFTQHILDGNWDESLNSLKKITILDEFAVKSSSFVILEQKFLQLLDSQKPLEALTTLRTEITPLSIHEKRVQDLSFLMFVDQGIVKPKPGSDVLRHLQTVFPPDLMIPEGRLINLVEQALELQREACSFHNSLGGETLYSDHNCGKDQIPSQTLQILQEHHDEVWFVQFSHNGRFLASSSKDKSAVIWEVSVDGRLSFKHRLLGHNQSVSCVSWNPGDDQLLTCGVEEAVRRWDVTSGECLHIYEKNDLGTISCGWSPDGEWVFSGFTDKSIVMWDLQGNEVDSWKGQKTLRISDLQITSDGQFMISVCRETMILMLNRETGFERLIKEDDNIVSFTLSEDNELLLVSLVNQEIHLWSIAGKIRLVRRYKGHKVSRFVVRACFGGLEQTFVASGSENSQVYIWQRDTGELVEILGGHSGAVNCTSWNPVNPHMLASASDDRTIRIWGLNHVNLNPK